MNTFEAIKLLMEQDIRADFGEIHNHESVAEHLAERIDTLWNENEKLKARNEQLEELLIDISCDCQHTCEYDWVMKHCPHKQAADIMEKKNDNE